MEIDRRQYIRSSDIDVSETERKEKTVMANESSSSSSSSSSSNGKKGRFRLFGVELNLRIRDEEEEMKKMKKKKEIDGGFEKIPETSRQSKKVIQWSREEHKRFLIGLKEKGRGNWKEIAVKYVKTRNKSQVASHAQKYYLHQKASRQNKQRRSVFDMSPEPRSSQASTSSSSSSCPEDDITSPGTSVPMKGNDEVNASNCSHGVPYMVGELPQNMVGFRSFGTQRFPSRVMCVPVPVIILPPGSISSSLIKFAATVADQHPK